VILAPGQRVEVRFTKWGGGRHWEFAATHLGTDRHGHWVAGAIGTVCTKPGSLFASEFAWVTLLPYDQPWVASFYDAPQHPVRTYVDITTVPEWSGPTVGWSTSTSTWSSAGTGSLFVDDEDEFAAHRVSLGYPQEIVDLARRSRDEVFAAIRDGTGPFGSRRFDRG
jgi:hypothetical protein